VTITGNQQVWRIGSSAFVETGRASQLVASGKFRYLANDPAMLPANQAKVGAIPSDEGVGKGAALKSGSKALYASADRLTDLQSWMLPKHLSVLDPGAHYGMTPITSGVLSISHDPAVAEFCGSSIKVSMSGVGTALTARLPLSNGLEPGITSQPIKVGAALHVRMKCSDWSALTRFYVGLTQDNGVTNYWLGIIVNSGQSKLGGRDPAYASAWDNKFRTVVLLSATNFSKVGSPAPWGADARYFNTDGINFTVSSTAAVDIHINRIYSPDWPAAVVCPILDGNYTSSRNLFTADFLARGWGYGASGNLLDGTGRYPSFAEMKATVDAGHDVFCHGHTLTGGTSPAPMSPSVTEAEYVPILAAQRRAFTAACANTGLRWHQWLTNTGQYAGSDLAGLLKKFGIDACRADTSDAEYGINPSATTYTQSGALIGAGGFAGQRGRFNRAYTPSYNGLTTGNYNNYDYDGTATLKKTFDYVRKSGLVMHPYFHEILDAPGVYDVGPDFYRAWIADTETSVAAGESIVIKPTDLERLTYWRSGEFFMRWDGEWVYRHDPTKIAF